MSAFERNTKEIIEYKMPRYNELPKIELYMDQLISYIEGVLRALQINDKDKFITTAMVNNYVKQGVIPPTEKKRYNKKHIAYLIVICILKQIYTINEISELIKIQADNVELLKAYDYFADEFETALQLTFTNTAEQMQKSTSKVQQHVFVRGSVIACANKLYVQKLMQFLE